MKSVRSSSLAPYAQSLLRMVAAASFMTHGTQKLFGVPGSGSGGTMSLFSQFGAAGVLELFGGSLMLIGLFSRPVALILSGEMAWAYLQVHAPRSIWPLLNGGETAMLYSFLWLYFAAAGPGPLSADVRR